MRPIKIITGIAAIALTALLSSCITESKSGSNPLNDMFSKYQLPALENETSSISRFTGYSANNTDTSRTIILKGETETGTGDSGMVEVINSMGKTVTYLSVTDGEYEQTIEIAEGRNVVRVTVYFEDKVVESGEFEIGSDREQIPVRVRLQWDQDLADVDLWILTPKGRYVWYGVKEAPDGSLDIDDTDGFGPETFSLLTADTGTYEVFVNLYDAHGQSETITATVLVSFDEGEWDTIATETFTANDADNSNQRKRSVYTFSVPGATPLDVDTVIPNDSTVVDPGEEIEEEVIEEEVIEEEVIEEEVVEEEVVEEEVL